MSTEAFVIAMGLPIVGAVAVWTATSRAWAEVHAGLTSERERHEARDRIIPFLPLPASLIVFGGALLRVIAGDDTPVPVALPASLAYGVSALMSDIGMAIVIRAGLSTAAGTQRGFGRFLTLALIPETGALFGLIISFLLIGSVGATRVSTFSTETVWLAAGLAMAGSAGGPLGGWLVSSFWDFKDYATWPKAMARATRGDYLTVIATAVAMAVLSQWLIVVLMILWFAAALAFGLAMFIRKRVQRRETMKPP